MKKAVEVNRREMLASTAGTAMALAAASASGQDIGPPETRPKKAVMYSMLPGSLSWEDRFKLARDVGFEGVEGPPCTEQEAEKLRKASDAAGLRIHSVIFGGWDAPLSSGDPETAARGLKNAENAMKAASIMGADDILLVPAVVDAHTRYADAYKRSQENVRKLIPLAEQLKVMVLIEEVWNNFLLSPLEYCGYVDSFKSRWVQSYFDVGNVVAFAWPEDWIRTVGKRIKKVHIKDSRRWLDSLRHLAGLCSRSSCFELDSCLSFRWVVARASALGPLEPLYEIYPNCIDRDAYRRCRHLYACRKHDQNANRD